jgi:hypothetical protein
VNGGLLSHVKIAVRSKDANDLAYLDRIIERCALIQAHSDTACVLL